MRAFLFSFALLSVLFLNSCTQESDWGKIIISAEQKLVFSEPDDFYGSKSIILLINNTDTMFVNNQRQIDRICYLRLAFPEKDIVIEYVKSIEDAKIVFDPRFINLLK
jgi:hypothetical protein